MTLIGYNHVCCVGAISGGPWHNVSSDKPESCAFTLAVPEVNRGVLFQTYVRCEAYGGSVEHALVLQKGDAILCEGKLSWSKGGGPKDKAQLAIIVWKILKLGDDAPESVEWC